MGSKIDKIKGRFKGAAGALTDNDSLKREGQRDQVVGEMKESAAQGADKVKETAAKVNEKVERAVARAKDA